MNPGLSLEPVPLEKRRASVLDVALVFAGANVVSTTLVTGGTLGAAEGDLSLPRLALTIGLGLLLGTLPVALLARLGPRYGLPSMVLLRDVFGVFGAALVSLLLVVTNFAWIALNNVIAADALEALAGGPAAGWSLLVGALAVVIALVGPRAMILFDRFAVPLLALLGLLLTARLLTLPAPAASTNAGSTALPLLAGIDVVAAYQLSWSLMFADYTRFQRRAGGASLAVLVGLGLSSAWLMTIGAGAARYGGGNDPTAMVIGLGLPVPVLAVVVLSTVTTNFVNLYLSSLAVRNLWPRIPALPTVLVVGVVGTGLGLASPGLLDSYAGFMALLAMVLLPIVAIGLVHFLRLRDPLRPPPLRPLAVGCWALGALGYLVLARLLPDGGATLPTLLGTAVLYAVLDRAATPTPELAGRSQPPRQ